jgi:hypothetical protein
MAEDFSLDISKWTQDADSQTKLFVVMLCSLLIRYIQARTPVLTGRLRASIGTNIPLADWEPGKDITIGTNVIYSRRVEYGFVGVDSLGRRYDQKGVGMFAQALAVAPQLADLVAKQTEGRGFENFEEVVEEVMGTLLEVGELGALL